MIQKQNEKKSMTSGGRLSSSFPSSLTKQMFHLKTPQNYEKKIPIPNYQGEQVHISYIVC